MFKTGIKNKAKQTAGSAVHIGSGTQQRVRGIGLSLSGLLVAVFMLVFGGFGSYFLLSSFADSRNNVPPTGSFTGLSCTYDSAAKEYKYTISARWIDKDAQSSAANAYITNKGGNGSTASKLTSKTENGPTNVWTVYRSALPDTAWPIKLFVHDVANATKDTWKQTDTANKPACPAPPAPVKPTPVRKPTPVATSTPTPTRTPTPVIAPTAPAKTPTPAPVKPVITCTTKIAHGKRCSNGTAQCVSGYFAKGASCAEISCKTIEHGKSCNDGTIKCVKGFDQSGDHCRRDNTEVVAYSGYNDGCGGNATHYAANRKTHVSQKNYGEDSVCKCNNGTIVPYDKPISDSVMNHCKASAVKSSPRNDKSTASSPVVKSKPKASKTEPAPSVSKKSKIKNNRSAGDSHKSGGSKSGSNNDSPKKSTNTASSKSCAKQGLAYDALRESCKTKQTGTKASSDKHICSKSDSFGDGCKDPANFNCGSHGQYHLYGASGCGCVGSYTGSRCAKPPKKTDCPTGYTPADQGGCRYVGSSNTKKPTKSTKAKQAPKSPSKKSCAKQGLAYDALRESCRTRSSAGSSRSTQSKPTCSSKGGDVGNYDQSYNRNGSVTYKAQGVCMVPNPASIQDVAGQYRGYYVCSDHYVSGENYNCHTKGGLRY